MRAGTSRVVPLLSRRSSRIRCWQTTTTGLITYFTNITNRWYAGGMRRATITLPDELEEALEAYRRSQEVPLALTAVTQAALQEYLERRGFLSPPAVREFVITPAEKGSGSNDVSAEHDRYVAEAAGEESKKRR